MSSIDPTDVVRYIEASANGCRVNIAWIMVSEQREVFARELDALLQDRPALVIVVRSRGFDDPNSLLADVVHLLNERKVYCVERLNGFPADSQLHIVLLAKKRLGLPQAASPVTLPDWLPVLSGLTLDTVIRDQTWELETSLKDERVGVSGLCEGLYHLEAAILRRFTHRLRIDPHAGDSFHGQLHGAISTNFPDLVEVFVAAQRSVTDPSAFRPSLRDGQFATTYLWRTLQTHGTEEIPRFAGSFAKALGVDDPETTSWSVGFMGMLFRSSNKLSPRVAFASDTIASVGIGCQLVTAAFHADSYPRYPVPLLVSTGQTLRASYSRAISFLDSLD